MNIFSEVKNVFNDFRTGNNQYEMESDLFSVMMTNGIEGWDGFRLFINHLDWYLFKSQRTNLSYEIARVRSHQEHVLLCAGCEECIDPKEFKAHYLCFVCNIRRHEQHVWTCEGCKDCDPSQEGSGPSFVPTREERTVCHTQVCRPCRARYERQAISAGSTRDDVEKSRAAHLEKCGFCIPRRSRYFSTTQTALWRTKTTPENSLPRLRPERGDG